MKKSILLALLGGAALAHNAQAQFVAGDLVVDRVGDGTQTLVNTGNSVFIDQFSRTGAAVGTSVSIPFTGVSALVQSGTASSEGALSLSQDGTQLVVAGYNTVTASTVSVSGATSAAVPRGVGTVSAAGGYSFVTPTTAFSANNIRTAASGANGNYYAGGGNSGTVIVNGGGAGTAAQTQTANTRVNNFANGNLYFSTGSATGNAGAGIYSLGSNPAAATAPTLLAATGTGSSPYDFTLNSTGTILYVADDRASAAGGIERFDLNGGGTFTLTYTLGTGVANIGARGLAVDFSGANPVIFATTAEATADRLITITDTGAASVATTLATAGANELFRGLDFAPVAAAGAVPEPSTYVMCLAALGGLVVVLRTRARRA